MSGRLVLRKQQGRESYFDRQERISWWDQGRISNSHILVIGAGAIGNEAIKNLILLGFSNVSICDFDTISRSNLSRTVLFGKEDLGKSKSQTAALRASDMALAPKPCLRWFDGDVVWDLGLGVYRAADIVLGCLDNVEARLASARP